MKSGRKTLLNNNDPDYIGNTNTTNIKIQENKKMDFETLKSSSSNFDKLTKPCNREKERNPCINFDKSV